jgi:hypothetical protein
MKKTICFILIGVLLASIAVSASDQIIRNAGQNLPSKPAMSKHIENLMAKDSDELNRHQKIDLNKYLEKLKKWEDKVAKIKSSEYWKWRY